MRIDIGFLADCCVVGADVVMRFGGGNTLDWCGTVAARIKHWGVLACSTMKQRQTAQGTSKAVPNTQWPHPIVRETKAWNTNVA